MLHFIFAFTVSGSVLHHQFRVHTNGRSFVGLEDTGQRSRLPRRDAHAQQEACKLMLTAHTMDI